MKKIIILLVIITLALIGFFLLTNDEKEEAPVDTDQKESTPEEEEKVEESMGETLEDEQDYLDMQGYYLYPPQGHNCEGGFTDGYRYLDAECTPEGRDDYEIHVGAGLASTRINPEKGLVANQIVVRSLEFTGEQRDVHVCREHSSERLNLGAEHYLCTYDKDGEPIITLGIGKSFHTSDSSFGRWFESHLIIKDDEYTEQDYIELLEKFINSSVKINWEDYKPEG